MRKLLRIMAAGFLAGEALAFAWLAGPTVWQPLLTLVLVTALVVGNIAALLFVAGAWDSSN